MPTLGEQIDTSHKHVSPTKTLSQHRRMNLQRSLNVSLTRLHTNKPAGTCNWPLPRHRPCLYDQKQEPKECVYLHLWMLETQYLCSNARLSPCTLDISVARMGGRTLYTMNTALLNLQADKPAPCPVSCMQTASQQSTVQPTSTSLQYPVSSQSRLAWQIVGPHVIHKWALAQHAQVTRPVSVEVTCFTYHMLLTLVY